MAGDCQEGRDARSGFFFRFWNREEDATDECLLTDTFRSWDGSRGGGEYDEGGGRAYWSVVSGGRHGFR